MCVSACVGGCVCEQACVSVGACVSEQETDAE